MSIGDLFFKFHLSNIFFLDPFTLLLILFCISYFRLDVYCVEVFNRFFLKFLCIYTIL